MINSLQRPVRARPPGLALVFQLFVGAACLTLLCACNKAKEESKATAPAESAAEGKAAANEPEGSHATVTASVATVQAESFTESVEGTGIVTASAGHVAALAAPAPTRITGVHVALGSHVQRGAKLVSFEGTAFEASVASADAALAAAELAAARARRLVDAGVSPRKDAELATAELAAARSASVNAHRTQQLAVLESPIDGVVTRLAAVLGASADVGQTLVEVTDARDLDIMLVLAPAVAAAVSTGQQVTFRDNGAADSKSIASGVVAGISVAVDSASRGVLIRVRVQNQTRTLRLGESVYGQIRTQTHRDALLIADDALVPSGDGFQVFVVDGEGQAHARPVTVGARAAHRVWISDGLKAGEKIVTAGAYGMDDGANVVTKKPQP